MCEFPHGILFTLLPQCDAEWTRELNGSISTALSTQIVHSLFGFDIQYLVRPIVIQSVLVELNYMHMGLASVLTRQHIPYRACAVPPFGHKVAV